MSKLPKLTLSHNDKKDRWELKNDKSDKVVKTFEKKEDATKGGVLAKTAGAEGASVKIQKLDGKFQEERTYPGSKDPEGSKG